MDDIEIRVYRKVGRNKLRTAKLTSPFGFFGWLRLYFILRRYSVKG